MSARCLRCGGTVLLGHDDWPGPPSARCLMCGREPVSAPEHVEPPEAPATAGRFAPEEDAILARMTLLGETCEAIGERLGRPVRAVADRRSIMRGRGVALGTQVRVPFTPEEDAMIRRSGSRDVEVARALGRHAAAIFSRRRRLERKEREAKK